MKLNAKNANKFLAERPVEKMNTENTNSEAKETQETSKQEPFKVFKSEEELQIFINQKVNLNEQKFKTKIESEIKEKLEKEAKLSAEEKLQEKIKELENEKKSVLIDKNRTKAEKEFVSKGFENYGEILDFVVNEDEETTLNRTKSIIQAIEKATDKKIKNAMKGVSKPESSEVKEQNGDEEIAKNLGKIQSEAYKTAAETLKKYL